MRDHRAINCHRLFLTAAACLFAAAHLQADPPAKVDARPTAEEIRQMVARLDSEEFSARDRAAERLAALVDAHQNDDLLVREFTQALLREATSSEVRFRLDQLLTRLPIAAAVDAAPPKAADIGPLIESLNSDAVSTRDTAERRLRALAAHDELVVPLLTALKSALADPGVKAHQRRVLEPILDRAREAWLASGGRPDGLPAVSAEQVAAWIDQVVASSQAGLLEGHRRASAERELLDLIARDDARPQVLALLGQRIESTRDAAVAGQLKQIADFARPAMAAEVWQNHGNLFVQYLIIGEPQHNAMTARPTHFDRIDDKTAHCVSGNSLLPGDYPVRVAIPHPDLGRDLLFYLTNLPTPRDRLAYEYNVRRDPAERLEEISRRTLDDILQHKRGMDEAHVLLLEQLDARAVSAFAGRYFQTVSNRPLVTLGNELAGQNTVHGAVCHILARIGTREALPALEQLARSGQLGDPTYECPFRIAWIAALAIAQRDALGGIDESLVRWMGEELPLVTNLDPPPDLGATAAATLLERHGASPHAFGLEAAGESLAERFRLSGYRFGSDADRQEVLRWWQRQKPSERHLDMP